MRRLTGNCGFQFFAIAAIVVCVAACGQPEVTMETTRILGDGWQLRAGSDVAEDGAVVSSPGFDAGGWFGASVPTTPMAALVGNGLYPDLYMGTNLEEVDTAQFDGPWWYRTEFVVSQDEAEAVARLVLNGVNYSAEVWLNGQRLASREETLGAFRVHELNVSSRLIVGANVLAVAVHPPQPGDFTIGFVDWNPRPPDNNMGIWRPVELRLTGDVSLDDVFVQTEVDLQGDTSAKLSVSATVKNHGHQQVESLVSGQIGSIEFSADVILEPGEEKAVVFTPGDYDALNVDDPRLWWPYTMGEPNLYALEMQAEVGGKISDTAKTTFGIRTVSTYFNDEGHRGF